MNRNIVVVVLVLASIACVAFSQLSDSTMGNPGTYLMQNDTFATTSQSNTVASTTAVTVTALSGRDYIEIRSGPNAGEEILVGIDTTPTATQGIIVTAASPLKLHLPETSVVKTIASGAWFMSVFQGAY